MQRFFAVLSIGLMAALFQSAQIGQAAEQDKPVELKVGDKAPEFVAEDDSGEAWKSKDHVGKKILVVYFYPADMTGGCTKQACAFRDDMDDLKELDVAVVGVSGDSARNHQLFKKAHDLNFPLLADEKGQVAKKFGVPVRDGGQIKRVIDEKEELLVRGVTASRWTFVIDTNGKIAAKSTKVDAAKDSKAVIELVKKMKEKA